MSEYLDNNFQQKDQGAGFNNYNNGFDENNYNNGYGAPNYNNGYDPNMNINSEKKGLAIASLVLSLVSLLCCICGLGLICAPLSIIFGIIALVSKRGGKGMAIAGIIISALVIIGMVGAYATYGTIFKVAFQYGMNEEEYKAEYERTGKAPADFDEYRDPKYNKQWKLVDCDNFDEFFGWLIENTDSSSSSVSYSSDEETPVSLTFKTEPMLV